MTTEHCRCRWVDLSKPDYINYHDKEWGVPVFDDQTLFEFIVLESAQAGLNWYTILKRRAHYRQAFAQFNVETVAKFNDDHVAKLLLNEGIVRNKAKIKAAISNAQAFINIQQEFGSFSHFLWQFVNYHPIVNTFADENLIPATTLLSDTITNALKQRGFTFFGSTICYAYLQAIGIVNDHALHCFRRKQIIEQYTKLIKVY
jgi:DNA-3-methyladenine glycosylase I